MLGKISRKNFLRGIFLRQISPEMTYLFAFALLLVVSPSTCTQPPPAPPSVTETNEGRNYESGQLIFEDNFTIFNTSTWNREVTMSGGGNWEFQAYQADPANSYVRDDKLFITPTLTACQGGDTFLQYGTIHYAPGVCTETDLKFYPCDRTGTPDYILPPIQSARLNTKNNFYFKYGRVEVRAKIPSGDYLWPAIWMLPQAETYGRWPASGEIDIMESRGNRNMMVNTADGNSQVNIGTEQISQTLHWGPYTDQDRYYKTHYEVQRIDKGYDQDFHLYGVIWTPTGITFTVDGVVTRDRISPQGGFWHFGEFDTKYTNPWNTPHPSMRPFDQPFYLILNLAVGGVNGYFPDVATDEHGNKAKNATWSNSSPHAAKDFWSAKQTWYDNNWMRSDVDPSFQVDYVRVYAI